jgi:hypothetical protein
VKNAMSYDDAAYDDDLPFSEMLSQKSNLGTWSSNYEFPIKKRHFVATRPVDVPLSRKVERTSKSTEKSFSLLNEELAFLK